MYLYLFYADDAFCINVQNMNKSCQMYFFPFHWIRKHTMVHKLSCDGGGGDWFCPAFFRIIFTAKTRHFQGCLRVWSRGHQVRRHPCKLGNLATFYNAKKINFFFYCFLRMEREWTESAPPPSNIRVKITPSNVRLNASFLAGVLISLKGQ